MAWWSSPLKKESFCRRLKITCKPNVNTCGTQILTVICCLIRFDTGNSAVNELYAQLYTTALCAQHFFLFPVGLVLFSALFSGFTLVFRFCFRVFSISSYCQWVPGVFVLRTVFRICFLVLRLGFRLWFRGFSISTISAFLDFVGLFSALFSGFTALASCFSLSRGHGIWFPFSILIFVRLGGRLVLVLSGTTRWSLGFRGFGTSHEETLVCVFD